MATVKLIQLDGKIPNLALMKLAHWHRRNGDSVLLSHHPQPDLWNQGPFDHVYASAIFQNSANLVRQVRQAYPNAVIGGTGVQGQLALTVESIINRERYEHYDYLDYPDYPWSLGFTQRGCRLSCGFCVVPKKEGKPVPANTVPDIWRPGTPKCILLLDNDFFGQPEPQWKARIKEIQDGSFRVSFSQGINIRMITQESAEALASIQYRDDQFERRRLYTAWDNLKQERVFFKGMELLNNAGIPPQHLMVYMLIGYRPGETIDDILYRHAKLADAGCMPYPMVYNDNPTLKAFQRWVIGRYAEFITWPRYQQGDAKKATQEEPECSTSQPWLTSSTNFIWPSLTNPVPIPIHANTSKP